MSWKSLVTAGLLCALATPVFAAPSIVLNKGGSVANSFLNPAGNWVWTVSIDPDQSEVPDATGTPLAAEFGIVITEGSYIPGSAQIINGATWDFANPGNVIFGWETLTPLGGSGDCLSGDPGDCPVGLQVEPIGNDGTINEIFVSYGSVNTTLDTPIGILQFETTGPRNGALGSRIELTGAYGANDDARVAQIDGGTPGGPYTTANFAIEDQFRRHLAGIGDLDLKGAVDGNSLLLFFQNYPTAAGAEWQNGNFDNNLNGTVDGNDLLLFFQGYPTAPYSVATSGPIPGGGSGGAVPEPASLVLVLVAGSLLGFRRMRG
jgi:hypothetical protein